ncbi:hypothetical protein QAD02_009868 [Eretmocerus hayati]|uniref:Uncharacterized protein n=1 Tax=Eretmocerus hayati TaxID=131215 RepID=A0ACC2NF38_9HYME|nr:hypothetical protein QAD02_009868 [Eretmocerus hayati]
MSFTESYNNSNELLDHVFPYIKEKLLVHQVTLITRTTDYFSGFAGSITKRIFSEFSTNLIESDKLKIPQTKDQRIQDEFWQSLITVQKYLKIGIVETKNQNNVVEEMTELLNLFTNKYPLVRGKYLIFLINGKNNTLEKFLRDAWSLRILDVTIIEWVSSNNEEENFSSILGLDSARDFGKKAVIHTYNPFYKKYSKNAMTIDTDIFPNKLTNLNGYPMHTLHRTISNKDDKKKVVKKENHERLRAPDLDQAVLRSLSESLNSTLVPAAVDERDNRLIVKAFQRPESECGTKIESNDLSFDARLDLSMIYDSNSKNGEGNSVTYSWTHNHLYFPTPLSFKLAVRLRRVSKINVDFHIIIISIVFFLIGLIFPLFTRLLRFKNRDWNIINITTAQMGGRIKQFNHIRVSNGIFLINLYVSTFIITTLMSGRILDFLYYHNDLTFTTLSDLADSGIMLTMHRHHIDILSDMYNDPILQKIVSQTIVVDDDEPSKLFCYAKSDQTVDDSVNACLLFPGYKIPKFHFENRDWVVGTIDEPVIYYLPFIRLRQSGLIYKNYLEKLFYRSLETGLVNHWQKFSENSHFSIVKSKDDSKAPLNRYIPSLKKENPEVPISIKLLWVLSIGYTIACIVLILEILWKLFIGSKKFGLLKNPRNVVA